MKDTMKDTMNIPIEIGTRVIPANSMFSFQQFRERGSYWTVASFTPKMVRIERNGHKKTIYSNELLNIEIYFKEYPELFL